MCHQIDSSVLIVNILKHKNNCTIQELIEIKNSLENNIPRVYVDISKNSIFSTIESNPSMLKWDNDSIEKVRDSDEFFEEDFIDNCFNIDVDSSVREKFIRVLNRFVIV
jgi:hypothetical protein